MDKEATAGGGGEARFTGGGVGRGGTGQGIWGHKLSKNGKEYSWKRGLGRSCAGEGARGRAAQCSGRACSKQGQPRWSEDRSISEGKGQRGWSGSGGCGGGGLAPAPRADGKAAGGGGLGNQQWRELSEKKRWRVQGCGLRLSGIPKGLVGGLES